MEGAEELLDVVGGAELRIVGAHGHLGVRQRSTDRFVDEEERRAERIGGVGEVTDALDGGDRVIDRGSKKLAAGIGSPE